MFRKMRRQDRIMADEKIHSLLKAGSYGLLSMVSLNGYGYGVPLNYVYYQDAIYFHCATEGSKVDNIKANNKVSFCIVGAAEPVPAKFTTRYQSVIAFGKASEVTGGEKEAAFTALVEKYCYDNLEEALEKVRTSFEKTAIYKLEIEHLTGKCRIVE